MTKNDRYKDIILSSIDVFARTNYESATTAMLAREAGVAEGTLYKYFPSKKELFMECNRYIDRQLIEKYEEIYKKYEGQPLESLKRVAQAYLEFVKENPSMRKFLAFVLNNSFDEEFLNELKGFLNLNISASERLITEAIKKGELRKEIDPHIAAWFFVGGYFTLILMAEIDADAVRDSGLMMKYVSAFFE